MNRLTLLFALLFASTAFAGGYGAKTFDQLDTNQDGQVSAEEASEDSKLKAKWSEVDRDASGAIDAAEFSAFETMEQPAGSMTDQPAGGMQ